MIQTQYLRSWLFVPGDDQNKLERAASSCADALILDWEDAVRPENKPRAREYCRDLKLLRLSEKQIFIRINSYQSQWHADDQRSMAAIQPDGIVLPKCESAEEILQITAALRKEARDWRYDLCPIIESPLGLLRVESIATASEKVTILAFGAQDFCSSAGIHTTVDETELLMARSTIITAAKAHRLAAIDSPVIVLNDRQVLRDSARRSYRLGFTGKLAIHPKHIPIIEETFAPTPTEARHAKEILHQAAIQKAGAFAWKGKMIDRAILEIARHTVQRFETYSKEKA